MAHHGMRLPRGMCKRGQGLDQSNRFGLMFPGAPRLISDPEDLIEAGKSGGRMDAGMAGTEGKSDVPLGFVFLGQLIDHDITLDVTSNLDAVNDPLATVNFRTPALDLDCIYGQGPDASRHLYYHGPEDRQGYVKAIDGKHLLTLGDDLARVPPDTPANTRTAALIGDFRNDENRVVSQLQLAMHRFHNNVVDTLLPLRGDDVLAEAQRLTRWHYQWAVVHDFLVRMVGHEVVEDILCNGLKIYTCAGRPFIPIEFSVAAYRFGHSMVASPLDYNDRHRGVELFGSELGMGFSRNEAGAIDWSMFFGPNAQAAGAFDHLLAHELLDLAFLEGEETEPHLRSLATRNLLRGQSFGLPSGQWVHRAVSEALGTELATPDIHALGLPDGLTSSTPLWLYILAEGALTEGRRMGPVGGRIVAEVLIGLLEADRTSYLGSNRAWRPDDLITCGEKWDMEALIAFASKEIERSADG